MRWSGRAAPRTVSEAWDRYRPALILIVPHPCDDILNEDIRAVAGVPHPGFGWLPSSRSSSLTGTKTIPARGQELAVRKSPETTV